MNDPKFLYLTFCATTLIIVISTIVYTLLKMHYASMACGTPL